MRTLSVLCLFLSLLPVQADNHEFAPEFYPFRNGVKLESVEAGVKYVKELGYPGIGSMYPQHLAEFKEHCDQEGLKVISVYCGSKVNGDGFSYGPEVPASIEMLKGTGALIELNVQRGKNPNDEQAIALVKEVGGLAKKAGLKVVLYPHANFHIERFDHAVKIAKASGCDNVGVIFNLCHFLHVQPDSDLRKSLEEGKDYLWAASTCGADVGGKGWGKLIQPLDQGTFDQVAFLRHLREVGFKGPVGLQCYNVKIPPKENLARSKKAWDKFLAQSRK